MDELDQMRICKMMYEDLVAAGIKPDEYTGEYTGPDRFLVYTGKYAELFRRKFKECQYYSDLTPMLFKRFILSDGFVLLGPGQSFGDALEAQVNRMIERYNTTGEELIEALFNAPSPETFMLFLEA